MPHYLFIYIVNVVICFTRRDVQRGHVVPEPGQYEGMHAASRFPHHGRGPFFERPAVEPLFEPRAADSLAAIVSTFMGPARTRAAAGPANSNSPRRASRGGGSGGSKAAVTGAMDNGGSLPDGVLWRAACMHCWIYGVYAEVLSRSERPVVEPCIDGMLWPDAHEAVRVA